MPDQPIAVLSSKLKRDMSDDEWPDWMHGNHSDTTPVFGWFAEDEQHFRFQSQEEAREHAKDAGYSPR